MNTKYILLTFAVTITLSIIGCDRNEKKSDAAPSGSSVRILSISPDSSTPLRRGEQVQLQVEVKYSLTVPSGTLGLVVQTANNSLIAQDLTVINEGNGTTHFNAEFIVPDTKTVAVFVPLSAQGQSATSTVDMRAFKVSDK